jgi:hypothetical protein
MFKAILRARGGDPYERGDGPGGIRRQLRFGANGAAAGACVIIGGRGRRAFLF